MSLFAARMKLVEASRFCQRFGTGLRSGVDVLRMLELEQNQGPPAQRKAMQRLASRVHAGDEVGEAMSKDIFFPTTLSSLMVAGDESGKVDRALLLLSDHYAKRLEARKTFVRAITFPLLQLVGGILVISLLIYLMGILTPATGGQMTDLLGWGLRGGSGVLMFWSYLLVILIFGFVVYFLIQRNVGGIQNMIPLIYRVPGIGSAIQTITLSKFCTAMALAYEAGLDSIRALHLGLSATGSEYYASAKPTVETEIRRGADLSGAMARTHVFPSSLLSEVSMAEESGTSAEGFNRLAKEYSDRADSAVRVLAGVATLTIRIAVIGVFVYMIFKIASVYIGALNGAMEPIDPRSGN